MSKELKKGALLYLPAGEHEICATVNGEPGKRRVCVTEACVAAFQRDLDTMLAAAEAGNAPRPCGFFDHKNGAAAFLPRGFRWQEGKGVMLDLEWTHAGQAAVEGKDYAYFSPRFALEGETPAGLLQEGVEVGSLVNDPAFRRMDEVAAGDASKKDAPAPAFPLKIDEKSAENLARQPGVEKPEKTCENSAMDKIKTMLGLPADADDAAVYAAIEKMKGAADKTQELEAAKCDLEKAKKDADKKEEELTAARAEIASLKASNEEAFINEHVAAGRIAPKDDAAKENWKKLYRADAVAAAAAITSVTPAAGKDAIVAGNVPANKTMSLDDMFAEKTK